MPRQPRHPLGIRRSRFHRLGGTVALPAAATLPDLSSVAEAALDGAANITSTNVVRREDPFAMFFGEAPSHGDLSESWFGRRRLP